MIMGLISKIFGTRSDREIKLLYPIVEKINQIYDQLSEKTDEELKRRHGNYYWLGRYLKECVECFGMEKPQKTLTLTEDRYWKVYHGINVQKTFIFNYSLFGFFVFI